MKTKRGSNKRQPRPRLKRAGIVVLTLLTLALLAYAQVIRPNQHAAAYERQLDAAAANLQGCFDGLRKTEQRQIFYAPDIPLATKRQDIEAIKAVIQDCDRQLARFNEEAQTLRRLHFSGYTSEYRTSQAHQRHAVNIAGQSDDVLDQYGRLLDFLDKYFANLEPFVTATTELNQTSDVSLLAGRTAALGETGNELHRRATAMRSLTPYPGFESIIPPTAAMLDQAADGFDNLAAGYGNADDGRITLGFRQVENAVAEYNRTVINLPFAHLQQSYTVKQVAGLQDKMQDLRPVKGE